MVYLARQEALDREVAVKVLRRDVEDPKVWREFRREAHTVARLSAHPHVVTVYTAGRSAVGQPYLVTEYLDRGSLADLIADGPVDAKDVATIGVAVADALAAAHDLGILHRDVKPGNVLLAHDGRIKLGDFGIARLLVGQSVGDHRPDRVHTGARRPGDPAQRARRSVERRVRPGLDARHGARRISAVPAAARRAYGRLPVAQGPRAAACPQQHGPGSARRARDPSARSGAVPPPIGDRAP